MASNLISEGSDLLLLVPSLRGLVGGVVLPILGAVPDGAIMLFSGLGNIESAQESLSVGVGALAGSTIMLLTVSWSLCVFAGRVDFLDDGTPAYLSKPKLKEKNSMSADLACTGISISKEVKHGAIIMIMTTLPYFIIQIPALFLHGEPAEEVAAGEKYWALGGLLICVSGFISYLYYQIIMSREGEDRLHRTEVIKNMMQSGKVSLSGALIDIVRTFDEEDKVKTKETDANYHQMQGSIKKLDDDVPSEEVKNYLRDVLKDIYRKYDKDGDGGLTVTEFSFFLRDFNESIKEGDIRTLFTSYDTNGDGEICLDEFIHACYRIIKSSQKPINYRASMTEVDRAHNSFVESCRFSNEFQDDEDEEEDLPEDITDLSPQEQQKAIKKKAAYMLLLGTITVLIFADPMVDVMQEVAVRVNVPPFYVSFVLAPLASNLSEVVASQYYAAKKTQKTITVALTTLEGAASMNNTFCLSIFMALIYFRGLAWQYTSETIAIVVSQLLVGFLTYTDTMTTARGLLILSIFPLSLLLVAGLEAVGFD